jgi:hypothetical protein
MALQRVLALSSSGANLQQLSDSDRARVGGVGAQSGTGPSSFVIEVSGTQTATLGASNFELSSGLNLSSAGGTAQLLNFDEWQNDGNMTIDANSASTTTLTLENAGAGSFELNVDGNATIVGNLDVQGTLTTINTTNLAVADRFIEHNAGYATDTAVTSGDSYIIDPDTSVQSAVDTGGFVAGVVATTDCDVTVVSSASFTVADLVQITGANDPDNNGIFEVASIPDATSLRLSGQLTANGEDFTKSDFTTDTTVAGTVTKVAVGVFQFSSAGVAQTAFGATTPLTFNNLATGGGNSLQQAYDVGAAIQLSDTSGDFTVDLDDTGTRANFIVRDEAGTANYLATDSAGGTLDLGSTTYAVESLGAFTASNGMTVSGASEVFALSATGTHTFTGGSLDIDVAMDTSSTVTNSGGEHLFTAGNLQMNDSIPLEIGTGADDSIIHNGTDTIWTHATGDFILDNTLVTGSTIMRLGTDTSATSFEVQNNSGTIHFSVDGSGSSINSNATHNFNATAFMGTNNLDFGTGDMIMASGGADWTATATGEVLFDTTGVTQFFGVQGGTDTTDTGMRQLNNNGDVMWQCLNGSATNADFTINGDITITGAVNATGGFDIDGTNANKFTFNEEATLTTQDFTCWTMLDGDGGSELMAVDFLHDAVNEKSVISTRLNSVTQGVQDRGYCLQVGSDTYALTTTVATSELKLVGHSTGDAVGVTEEMSWLLDPANSEIYCVGPNDFNFRQSINATSTGAWLIEDAGNNSYINLDTSGEIIGLSNATTNAQVQVIGSGGLDVDGPTTLDSTTINTTDANFVVNGSGSGDFDVETDFSAGVIISADTLDFADDVAATFGVADANVSWVSASDIWLFDNVNAGGTTAFDLGTNTLATEFQIRNNSSTVLFEVDGAGAVQVPSGSNLDVDGTSDFSGNVNITSTSTLDIGSSAALNLRLNAGTPQGSVTGSEGDILFDSTGNDLYVNTDAASGTNWAQMNSEGATPDATQNNSVLIGTVAGPWVEETDLTIDTSGNLSTTGTFNADGSCDLGAPGGAADTNVLGDLDVDENLLVNGTSEFQGDITLTDAIIDQNITTLNSAENLIDQTYGAGSLSAAKIGLYQDLSGLTDATVGSDFYGIQSIGITNSNGSFDSVGASFSGWDVGIENNDPVHHLSGGDSIYFDNVSAYFGDGGSTGEADLSSDGTNFIIQLLNNADMHVNLDASSDFTIFNDSAAALHSITEAGVHTIDTAASNTLAWNLNDGTNTIINANTTSNTLSLGNGTDEWTVTVDNYLNPGGGDGEGLIGNLTTKWMDGATDNWNGMPYSITDASGTFTAVSAGLLTVTGNQTYFGGTANTTAGGILVLSGTNGPTTPWAISAVTSTAGAWSWTMTFDLLATPAPSIGNMGEAITAHVDLGPAFDAVETIPGAIAAGDDSTTFDVLGGITVEGSANWGHEFLWSEITPNVNEGGNIGSEAKAVNEVVAVTDVRVVKISGSVSQWDPLDHNGTDWAAADASAIGTCGAPALIAMEAGTDGQTIRAAAEGSILKGVTAGTQGAVGFVSTATGITTTAPSGASEVVAPVCVYQETDEILIRFLKPVELSA